MHAELPDAPLDIVGDIHGEHDALVALLLTLGYDDAVGHPDGRHLVFVGDLCGRGPDSPGVVAGVRRLVASGRALAVRGNHEVNLLRSERKQGNDWFWGEGALHDAKFKPCASLPAEERESVLDFFGRLPLTLTRRDLRVTHAASHDESIARLSARADVPPLAEQFTVWDCDAEAKLAADGSHVRAQAERAQWRHHFNAPAVAMPMIPAVGRCEELRQLHNPIRVLTSGFERRAGASFFASGQWRFAERVRWWDDFDDETPVVVAHYWRQFLPLDRSALGKGDADLFAGVPAASWVGCRGNVFCIDYSVGRRFEERRGAVEPGSRTKLGALRWPERELVLDTGERLPTTGFGERLGI